MPASLAEGGRRSPFSERRRNCCWGSPEAAGRLPVSTRAFQRRCLPGPLPPSVRTLDSSVWERALRELRGSAGEVWPAGPPRVPQQVQVPVEGEGGIKATTPEPLRQTEPDHTTLFQASKSSSSTFTLMASCKRRIVLLVLTETNLHREGAGKGWDGCLGYIYLDASSVIDPCLGTAGVLIPMRSQKGL